MCDSRELQTLRDDKESSVIYRSITPRCILTRKAVHEKKFRTGRAGANFFCRGNQGEGSQSRFVRQPNDFRAPIDALKISLVTAFLRFFAIGGNEFLNPGDDWSEIMRTDWVAASGKSTGRCLQKNCGRRDCFDWAEYFTL
jgi:hypothetical protein